MNPGRDLDALVAEKVMGYPGAAIGGWSNPHVGDPRPYSTDVAAAWEVLEKLRDEGKPMSVGHVYTMKDKSWDYIARVEWIGQLEPCFATAKTAPHCICLAALKAKGVEG